MTSDRFLTVDGRRFHYIWLRDNCLCPKCRHPTSFQKLYDISEAKSPPEPLSVVEENNELIITWKEQPVHKSIFPVSWLMAHSYDREAGLGNLHQQLEYSHDRQITWNKTSLETHPAPKHDLEHNGDSTWIEQILTHGFAVLKNLQNLEAFIANIGPVHHTEGGKIYVVKSAPGANDLSETGYPLDPHTDYETYMYASHLLQFLHCVEHQANGGESILVDGFKVAEDFRQNHPDYFNLLTDIPVQFQQFYTDWQYYHRRSRSAIELDRTGRVTGVYFGHSHACNWNIPFECMEDYYQAYCAFFRYLKNPIYQYCFHLQPGDCIVVQNFRVLHGRKAFDANSGARQLNVSYVAWDYFTGQENFKRFKDLYLQHN